MYGRSDVQKYRNGASRLRNMVVRPQGGAFRRVGGRMVRSTRFPSQRSVLVPFEFSDEQVYVLEFGVGYIHFYREGRPLYETTTTEIEAFRVASNGGSMQITSGSPSPTLSDLPNWTASAIANNGSGAVRMTFTVPHTIRTGQIGYVTSAAYPTINGQYTLTRISQYVVDLQGSTFNASMTNGILYSHGLMAGDPFFVSGAPNYPTLTEQHHVVKSVEDYYRFTVANVPYVNNGNPTGEEIHSIPIEVVTSYAEADLTGLYFAQSADVLYIAHENYPVMKLTRLDTDGDQLDWYFSQVDFSDGPYQDINDAAPIFNSSSPQRGTKFPSVYLELSSYTHTASVKVMAGAGWAAGAPSADSGKYIEYRDGDQWKLAKLPAGLTAAGTTATVTIVDNVLTFIDRTTKLQQRKGRPSSVPASEGSSEVVYQNYDSRRVVSRTAKVDPNDELQETAGVISSQYANTFGTEDIGKFVRYHAASSAAGTWGQITGLVRNKAGREVNVTAVSMASNNATAKFRISGETRTVDITARDQETGVVADIFSPYLPPLPTEVGRHIRLGFGNRWSWGKITTHTSSSVVSVTLREDLPRDPHDAANIAGNQDTGSPNSGVCFDWRLGAWGATTGYPSVVCFHEQRLVFGRTPVSPQTLWMSRSGDYENFAPSDLDGVVVDDSAVTYTITSGMVSPIKWLVSGSVLLVGGLGQEWQVRAATSVQEPITPTNISVTPQTDFGSRANARPRAIGSAVLFLDRKGKKLREMLYNFELDRYVARDVSIASEHLLRESPGTYTESQTDPCNVLWSVRDDGVLLGMTYERDHEVVGWHRHDVGGSGVVESIARAPSSSGADRLYLIVRRTINGATSRLVEVIEQDFHGGIDASSAADDQPFLDAHSNVDKSYTMTVIEGLQYLEGETVGVVADGAYIGTKTVSSGTVMLGGSYSHVILGYNFTSLVGVLPLEAGAILGTSQVKLKRVGRVGVRVYRTSSFKHCSAEGGTYVPETMPSVFYTGDYRFQLEQGNQYTGEFFIKQDLPEPLNLLLVAPEELTMEVA